MDAAFRYHDKNFYKFFYISGSGLLAYFINAVVVNYYNLN